MKIKLILGLTFALMLSGCQVEHNIEVDQRGETGEAVVIETAVDVEKVVLDDESEAVAKDIVGVLEDSVASELHEWTEQDTAKLKEFTSQADDLSLEATKKLLDDKIEDASNMMADEYVAYYEERLISELPQVSDSFFEGSIQEDMVSAFNYNYFSRNQLETLDDNRIVEMIDPLYDIGYKVETSEGMYYPIVDYSVLYKYEDHVTSGVKKYLRLMKRQSDIMAYSDAAVVVPWSELGDRLLMAEALQSEYLPKTMKQRVEQEFEWAFMTYVFGTNNTPVFDFKNNVISDSEIIASFREVAKKGGDTVKHVMLPYLKILEEEEYKGTDKVYETVNKLLNEYVKDK